MVVRAADDMARHGTPRPSAHSEHSAHSTHSTARHTHLVLPLLLNQVQRNGELLELVRADVWAVREAKVQDGELAQQVPMCERLAILVRQQKGPADGRLAHHLLAALHHALHLFLRAVLRDGHDGQERADAQQHAVEGDGAALAAAAAAAAAACCCGCSRLAARKRAPRSGRQPRVADRMVRAEDGRAPATS
jgi:hypothetical protein